MPKKKDSVPKDPLEQKAIIVNAKLAKENDDLKSKLAEMKEKYRHCKCVPKPKKELSKEELEIKNKLAEEKREDAKRKKEEILRLEQENEDLRLMLKKVLVGEEEK